MKLPALALGLAALAAPALAQEQGTEGDKPNILLILSDDTGWGDLGPYLDGEARGMQTPPSRLSTGQVTASRDGVAPSSRGGV